MNGLRDAVDSVEGRRKRLEVYAPDTEPATELERQFATRNVDVDRRSIPTVTEPGFVILRSHDGAFRGAIGLEQFEALLSPDGHPPWELAESNADPSELFDFLENTLFSSYDRRQMLIAAREIEERAWRVAEGALYAGFQRERAFAEQAAVYERLASRGRLAVTVFVRDEWEGRIDDVAVVSETNGEIGEFWFVIFDGAGRELRTCALVAEERRPDRFYGFWTYDPAVVDDLVGYLESTYETARG